MAKHVQALAAFASKCFASSRSAAPISVTPLTERSVQVNWSTGTGVATFQCAPLEKSKTRTNNLALTFSTATRRISGIASRIATSMDRWVQAGLSDCTGRISKGRAWIPKIGDACTLDRPCAALYVAFEVDCNRQIRSGRISTESSRHSDYRQR